MAKAHGSSSTDIYDLVRALRTYRMARWAAQHVPACAEDTPRFDELCCGEALAHVGDLGAAQKERLLLGRERVGAAPAFLKLV